MQFVPVELAQLIGVIMGTSIVLIPVIGLTARFAFKSLAALRAPARVRLAASPSSSGASPSSSARCSSGCPPRWRRPAWASRWSARPAARLAATTSVIAPIEPGMVVRPPSAGRENRTRTGAGGSARVRTAGAGGALRSSADGACAQASSPPRPCVSRLDPSAHLGAR
jgi:hypothetical protein